MKVVHFETCLINLFSGTFWFRDRKDCTTKRESGRGGCEPLKCDRFKWPGEGLIPKRIPTFNPSSSRQGENRMLASKFKKNGLLCHAECFYIRIFGAELHGRTRRVFIFTRFIIVIRNVSPLRNDAKRWQESPGKSWEKYLACFLPSAYEYKGKNVVFFFALRVFRAYSGIGIKKPGKVPFLWLTTCIQEDCAFDICFL